VTPKGQVVIPMQLGLEPNITKTAGQLFRSNR